MGYSGEHWLQRAKDHADYYYGGKGLSVCTIEELERYFPDYDLHRIKVYEELPWLVRAFSLVDAAAFTWGDDIYFAKGQYSPASAAGLSLLGHEITHSIQFATDGKIGFATRYAVSFIFGYKNIPYERQAYQMQGMIFNDLIRPK